LARTIRLARCSARVSVEAHRVSLSVHQQPRTALAAQTPLVLLMVSYTFAGLWVLGKSLSGG
jgi:hypothetical protein